MMTPGESRCKFCGERIYWGRINGRSIPLVLVPGTLFATVDGSFGPVTSSVYRPHYCDPIAREEWQLKQFEAAHTPNDNGQAELAAYVEQEQRDRQAYLRTPAGAKEGAVEHQSKFSKGALTVACPKCRVDPGEPCVKMAVVGADWDLKARDYLRGPHKERIALVPTN